MEKPVVIEHYNENWPIEYIEVERKIMEIFRQKAIAIEHIGSTSVQGLGAKPVIDFMVGVSRLFKDSSRSLK